MEIYLIETCRKRIYPAIDLKNLEQEKELLITQDDLQEYGY